MTYLLRLRSIASVLVFVLIASASPAQDAAIQVTVDGGATRIVVLANGETSIVRMKSDGTEEVAINVLGNVVGGNNFVWEWVSDEVSP